MGTLVLGMSVLGGGYLLAVSFSMKDMAISGGVTETSDVEFMTFVVFHAAGILLAIVGSALGWVILQLSEKTPSVAGLAVEPEAGTP